MADNTLLNPGIGGDTARTLDRGAAKTQVAQIDLGGAAGEALWQSTTTIPNDNVAAPPVRPVPSDLWRCSFAAVGSGVVAPEMSLLQTGGGMAVSQSAGNLVVTTGTTANAETLVRSVRAFRGDHILRYKAVLSQRIANNNFSVELADLIGSALAYNINSATSVTVTFGVNPFTAANVGQFVNFSVITGAAGIPGRYAIASVSGATVTFTVAGWPASGSGTLTLWGWNYHRVLYNGTTATSAAYDAQRRGWATGDTTATINTTASPGHVGHLQSMCTLAAYADALAASNAAYQFTPRASRVENLPDDDVDLYLFVRVRNGTAAPATTTTFTLGFLSVEMTGRQKVYLGGADQCGAPFASMVQISNTVPVSGTLTSAGTTTNTPVTPTTTFTNSAASTNATSIKASAGTLWSVVVSNINAAARFVKLYNLATAPTVGTSVPAFTITVPAGGSVVIEGGANGLRFATGIALAITAAAADSDTTAVAANDVKVATTFT